jgi:hypothetical protein
MTINRFGSELDVNFKVYEFFPLILQQQLSMLDFVSYCGGSLGLLLGFSLISAIEIVYYFSLRILFDKRNRVGVTPAEEQSTVQNKQRNFLVETIGSLSIHGCSQTVMDKRHWIEKIFWMIVVVATLTICSKPTYTLYLNYQNSPVILKYEDVLSSHEMVIVLTYAKLDQVNDNFQSCRFLFLP